MQPIIIPNKSVARVSYASQLSTPINTPSGSFTNSMLPPIEQRTIDQSLDSTATTCNRTPTNTLPLLGIFRDSQSFIPQPSAPSRTRPIGPSGFPLYQNHDQIHFLQRIELARAMGYQKLQQSEDSIIDTTPRPR